MCSSTSCDMAIGPEVAKQLNHDGMEASVFIEGDGVWRGAPMPTPTVSVYKLFLNLSECKVIPKLLQQKTCGKWWWVKTEYLQGGVDPGLLDSWKNLAVLLAKWHAVANEQNSGGEDSKQAQWVQGYAVRGGTGPEGLCHTDLHDQNAVSSGEDVYIIDCWRPLYGPFGVDVGVLAVGAVVMLQDWVAWDVVMSSYAQAGGIGRTESLNINDLFNLVAGYGPDAFAIKVLQTLIQLVPERGRWANSGNIPNTVSEMLVN